MKPPLYLKLLCLAALMVCSAFAQTKTVLKNVGANTLTESFIVPSGASITVAPGASIVNQGTATGFDSSSLVPWANITGKPTTLSGFGITDGLTTSAAASTYLTQASATSTYLTQSAAASTYLTSVTAASTYLTLSAAASTYLTQAAAVAGYQPKDDDLTSIAALTTTTFGRSLLTGADASATRTTLGLGTLATQSGTLSDYLTLSAASSTYLTKAAAASTYLTSTSASSTYLTSATASSTYLTQAAASTYLTQAAAIAGYQPKDADLTSIAALTTTTFGRSLLTQPSAVDARRAIQASIEVPAVQQVTQLSVGGVTNGSYIDVYYSSTAVMRLWWNVDFGNPSIPSPSSGMMVEVAVNSGGTTNEWAYALYAAASTYSPGTGLTFSYSGGQYVDVTQPTGVTTPVDLSNSGGTVSATITTPGAEGYDKLPGLRMDDMVLLGQTPGTSSVPYFDGSIWVTANSLSWSFVDKTNSSIAQLETRSASDLNSGTLAGARLPAPTTTVLGGVKRNTGTTGQYVSGIDSAGALLYGGPAPDVRSYTANSTWTNPSPSTPRRVFVRLVGGGGGGGSGRKGAAATLRAGGGGGAAAAVVEFWTTTTELGATEAVTVGAGGIGGAAQTTDATNGNAGTDGGSSTFAGTTAVGGNGGAGGTSAVTASGAGVASASVVGVTAVSSSAGGNGGTAAGAAAASVAFNAPTGGGGGGGLDTANTNRAGGAGGGMGAAAATVLINGGSAGAAGGSNGGNGSAGRGSGTGGGGGGSTSTGAGGNGGNGGGYGSGGGGGGAGTSAVGNSGKGGDGTPGYVFIITY